MQGLKIEKNAAITISINTCRILIKMPGTSYKNCFKQEWQKTLIFVIDKTLALKSYNVTINGKRSLLFSDAIVLQDGNSFSLLSDKENSYDLAVYPKLKSTVSVSNGTIREKT